MKTPVGIVLTWVVLAMAPVSGEPRTFTYFQTFPTTNHNKEVVYEYRYAVDDEASGVINDHWEHRTGDFVKGAYSLLEPTGKVRTVSYEVDGPKGFTAVVRTHFPANALLSTQQLIQSNSLHPEPDINLGLEPVVEDILKVNPTINYHALAATYTGQRVTGTHTRPQQNEQIFQKFPRATVPRIFPRTSISRGRFQRELRKRI